MSLESRERLIELVPQIFRPMPPIGDLELLPGGFSSLGAAPPVLSVLRGKDRFELASSLSWLDPEILYRMSGYARWYFAPTFMLLALHHLERFEFDGLMNVFKYSDDIVAAAGSDPFRGNSVDVQSLKVEMHLLVHELSIADCLPATEKLYVSLNAEHFAVSASWFNAVERKLVSEFLRWLHGKWPGDVGVKLALVTFWDQ